MNADPAAQRTLLDLAEVDAADLGQLDDFARFPTIADLYEEQAMRRATRAEVSREQA